MCPGSSQHLGFPRASHLLPWVPGFPTLKQNRGPVTPETPPLAPQDAMPVCVEKLTERLKVPAPTPLGRAALSAGVYDAFSHSRAPLIPTLTGEEDRQSHCSFHR